MVIRPANLNDIGILNEQDRHISKEELENSVKSGRIFIAEEEGAFCGWLRYNLFWDSIPFMNMLYVLENRRGRKTGTKLVEFWEDRMKKLKYDRVMTSTASDESAQHFYTGLGYRAVGGFLPGNDPFEIIMAKDLKLRDISRP